MSKAERIAELIGAQDAASRWLGMKLEEVRDACNTHNQRALAAGASIDFLRPAHLDDILVSECKEEAHAGRRGVYDARVTNQRGETVAVFRGQSATVKGTWIE